MASFTKLVVPAHLATSFTPAEVRDIQAIFGEFDANGDGTIDRREISLILTRLGESPKEEDVNTLLAEADADKDGKISFGEFCVFYNGLRQSGGNTGKLATVVKKAAGSFLKLEGAGGASHTFSEEEKVAFSEHVNNCLAGDPVCAPHLPLDPSSNHLFERTGDGLIFCKLINLAVADTIDERALNKKVPMNIYQKTENLNLALNAAKGIGCQIVNIGSQDLVEGRPILVLGLIWQIIKIQLLSQISLKNYPELVLLLETDEDMASLLKLPPEDILLRWFNYHLNKAGCGRKVSNFGNDLKDSFCYSVLLHQLSPTQCTLANENDLTQRADHIIRNARTLGVAPFIHAADICSGNKKLNMGFVAQLFNTCPGLRLTEEMKGTFDFSQLELDDAGDSREERVFRMWINSLAIPELYINDLFADLADGVAILKLEDRVEPGSVNFKRVNLNPTSRFKKVENCNYAVTVAKDMKFSIVNIGGIDIVDGRKKLILAIIWQLMRKYTLGVLATLAASNGITDINEDHIIAWANQKVAASGKSSTMRSFKDSSLSNGHFFLDLVGAIEPRAVNWELVTPGETPEDKMSNAKYSISIARKVGACVFLTPEDVVEVKSKMLLTFVASLWATDMTYRR